MLDRGAGQPWVFLGATGGPMTGGAVGAVIKKAAARVGLREQVHAHVLRHTTATDLLERGWNLRQVQEYLGHASIISTEVYTHVAISKMKDSFMKLRSGERQRGVQT